METLELIEEYFKGELSAEERSQFENNVRQDPAFAKEVAFYVSTEFASGELLIEEKKNRFRQLEQTPANGRLISMKPVWWAAAAAVLILVFVYLGMERTSVNTLADNYIEQKYSKIEASMGVSENLTQQGIAAYNKADFATARINFEQALKLNDSDNKALEYAGIAALKMKQYETAIAHFSKLSRLPGLYENRGPFLEATTLLVRDAANDRERARILLEDVVSRKLYGSAEAQHWLNRLQK